MTHSQKATELFKEGCNCSQAVFAAFADELGIEKNAALRLSCGLGGGVGRMREVCGAVSGGAMVLGMYFSGEDGKDKARVYALVQKLAAGFKAQCGTIVCRELLELPEDEQITAKPEERTPQYYKKRPCAQLVAIAAEAVDKILESEPNA